MKTTPIAVIQLALEGFREVLKRVPSTIGIETQTICNRACLYCPNSTEQRPKAVLPTETYCRVLGELAQIGFRGELQLHGWGEPLLDKRILELMTMARNTIPKCTIVIATNGDYLTGELMDELEKAGCSRLLITDHSRVGMITSRSYFRRMKIIHRSLDDLPMENVSGHVSLPIRWRRMPACPRAARPWITAAGDVAFCCRDYAARHGTGINVNQADWLKRWLSWPKRLERLRAVIGPRPRQCCGCLTAVDWKNEYAEVMDETL